MISAVKSISSSRIRFVGILCVFLSGCATTGEHYNPEQTSPSHKVSYHKVIKGETLWRIAQTYHVSMEQIVAANNMPSGAHLEEGQLLVIPGSEISRASLPRQTVSRAVDDVNKQDFIWPLRGNILHYFGERRGGILYKGIMIEANTGEKVQAARQGTVVFADYLAGYEYTVILDHQDGYFSVYGHNAKILVRLGDQINKGEQIAEVGRYGRLASLYFEIRKKGQANDPLHYLPRI